MQNNNITPRKDLDYYIGTTAIASDNYQEGIERQEKCLASDFELTGERRAYVNSHIGFAKARLGDSEGENILRESLKVLIETKNENISNGKNIMAVWKTGVELALAQITDDEAEKRQLIDQVIKEATEENLGARLAEANKLLEI